jgi:adenylosuccinate synthase
MPAHVIIGAQWGDEGKGKIADLLAAEADIVARYGGGDNAGHTVVLGDRTFKFHLLPSGMLYPDAICLLGNGVVINPETLIRELDALEAGLTRHARLVISDRAHLVMPYHRALDGAAETARGKGAIGTTRRGIGPAYSDKAARRGLRVHELLRGEGEMAGRIRESATLANELLQRIYGQEPCAVEEMVEKYLGYARRLAPLVGDVSVILDEALRAGKVVLCEGAQGVLLDIDHGTYPYVTSSYPSVGGALVGLGMGPRYLERIIGVVKAYTTRVGGGPFLTELFDQVGDRLVEVGREYGTTTGRRRRVGWLDTVVLRYVARISGLTEIALTKLDVLGGLERLRVCVAYESDDGERLAHFPADLSLLQRCRPVYEDLPGWDEDISAARTFAGLPAAARGYVEWIESHLGLPVTLVSVGPERSQTIVRNG